jgi:hypothetical protein
VLISSVSGLALSPMGTLYAAASYQIYSISTGTSTTTALLAGSCCGYTDGVGTNAKFDTIEQIAVGSDGATIYAIDEYCCVVRTVSTSGETFSFCFMRYLQISVCVYL